MVLAVRIFGLTTEPKPSATWTLSIIIPMRFEDLTFWLMGFLNDTREFDQYIAICVVQFGIMRRFTSEEEDRTKVVKTAWKSFKSVIEKDYWI